jgi:hypothetical protein
MAQRFHAPESIEEDSPMTRDGEYRSKLLNLLADQARAELEASNTYSKWIHKAPGPEERMHLAEIAHTEQYIRLGLKYRGNEDRRKAFCRDCERQIQELAFKFLNYTNIPIPSSDFLLCQ